MQAISTAQTITLHLPDLIYQQVTRMAQTLRRPVEEILLDAVTTALPPLAGLPNEMADDLSNLAFVNDEELWQIARSTLSKDHYEQMDALLAQKGQGQLTLAEQRKIDQLLLEYQTHVLRRGQAAVLLQNRGYKMSDSTVLNSTP